MSTEQSTPSPLYVMSYIRMQIEDKPYHPIANIVFYLKYDELRKYPIQINGLTLKVSPFASLTDLELKNIIAGAFCPAFVNKSRFEVLNLIKRSEQSIKNYV